MQSTSSSDFHKDYNSNHAYQCDKLQFAQSSFDFVQNFDQFDLEQSCLIRLKAQRQKIEQLTKLYQQNEQQLQQQADRQKQLQEEIERLTDMSQYKQSYSQLKKQYEALSKRNEITERHCEELKKQLDELATACNQQIQTLKLEVKSQKEQRELSNNHWQAILSDKQEQIQKESRISQEREFQLSQKIKSLEEQVESLKQALNERGSQYQDHKQYFQKEISLRDEDLLNFEKVLESFKKQNAEYKIKLIELQNNFDKERTEYIELNEQLKHQIKLIKRDQQQKQNQLYEYREIIKKCDAKNQNLETTVSSLKSNLKKFKVNTDSNIKKLADDTQEERNRLQLFIQQLKAEVQKQMDEKSALSLQVKKLRGLIERKQQQEKQRKILLMSEFRQIDKMQKVVKKIL